MASDYLDTDQALEMFLRDGRDLKGQENVEDNFDDRESYTWHVAPFFREREVFPN